MYISGWGLASGHFKRRRYIEKIVVGYATNNTPNPFAAVAVHDEIIYPRKKSNPLKADAGASDLGRIYRWA
jgi:hypothetical protein